MRNGGNWQPEKKDFVTDYGVWLLSCLPLLGTSVVGLLGEVVVGKLFATVANLLQGQRSNNLDIISPFAVALGIGLAACIELKEWRAPWHILFAVLGSYFGLGAGSPAFEEDPNSMLMQCAIFSSFFVILWKPKFRNGSRVVVLLSMFCLSIKIAIINKRNLKCQAWADHVSSCGELLKISLTSLLIVAFRVVTQLFFNKFFMAIADAAVSEEIMFRYRRIISSIPLSLALCLVSGVDSQPFYWRMVGSMTGAYIGIWIVDDVYDASVTPVHGAFSSSLVMSLWECWSEKGVYNFKKFTILFWWICLYSCLWRATIAFDDYQKEEKRREFERQWYESQWQEKQKRKEKEKEKEERKKNSALHALGLSPGATKEEIRCVWIKLAKQNHPDKNSPEDKREAEQRFQNIQRAYDFLKDL